MGEFVQISEEGQHESVACAKRARGPIEAANLIGALVHCSKLEDSTDLAHVVYVNVGGRLPMYGYPLDENGRSFFPLAPLGHIGATLFDFCGRAARSRSTYSMWADLAVHLPLKVNEAGWAVWSLYKRRELDAYNLRGTRPLVHVSPSNMQIFEQHEAVGGHAIWYLPPASLERLRRDAIEAYPLDEHQLLLESRAAGTDYYWAKAVRL